jgi:hypothetical protein
MRPPRRGASKKNPRESRARSSKPGVERVYYSALYARAVADGMDVDVAAQGRDKLAEPVADDRGPMAQLARALGLDELRRDLVWSIVACSYDPRIALHLVTSRPAARHGCSSAATITVRPLWRSSRSSRRRGCTASIQSST